MIDNSSYIRAFVPDVDDGDTFIYTEMLDRGKRKGNNGVRLLKTFYHRSKEEFDTQLPTIQNLCDMSLVRACTRVAPRSYKKVAGTFLRLVTETYVTQNYAGMKTLYNRACGTTSPNKKIWLVDCDTGEQFTRALHTLTVVFPEHEPAIVPSKSCCHILVVPFNMALWPHKDITIHKDNPTNLYIPEGAD